MNQDDDKDISELVESRKGEESVEVDLIELVKDVLPLRDIAFEICKAHTAKSFWGLANKLYKAGVPADRAKRMARVATRSRKFLWNGKKTPLD